jgi:hypothetical protein
MLGTGSEGIQQVRMKHGTSRDSGIMWLQTVSSQSSEISLWRPTSMDSHGDLLNRCQIFVLFSSHQV